MSGLKQEQTKAAAPHKRCVRRDSQGTTRIARKLSELPVVLLPIGIVDLCQTRAINS